MFSTSEETLEYVYAGNATFTMSSIKTGSHYTFKVKKSVDGNVLFVSMLTAPEVWTYIGLLKGNALIKLTAKSRYGYDSIPVKAFNYMLRNLLADKMPPFMLIRHEGKCGRCGRKLTHPESIDRGIGPECIRLKCEAA